MNTITYPVFENGLLLTNVTLHKDCDSFAAWSEIKHLGKLKGKNITHFHLEKNKKIEVTTK